MAKGGRAPGRNKDDAGVAALKAAKKNTTAAKGRAPRKAPKPARGGRRPFFVAVRAWIRAILVSTAVGAVVGGGIIGGTMYRWAVGEVDAGLAGDVWTVPGHVWSGPIEVWPGLAYTPEAFAADLAAAGYARVARAEKPGDFQVAADAVVVHGRAATGPGWSVKAEEVLVTFADGHVRSVSPDDRASFAPAALATIRGPDNENRSPVPLDRIPRNLRNAVIAMEDARFYDHPGLDALGIARAVWVDVTHREFKQGGSSLTQQVAKNLFLTQDKTAERKLREALLALALEQRLGKDEILRLYLNEIYLGQLGGSALCGMDAAARAYFGKPVERIGLGEAATLAGIIAAPNTWSPARYPERAQERRDIALDRMVATGAIDAAAAAAAKKEPLVTHLPAAGRMAPWAVDQAVEVVEQALGEGTVARDALEVQTTLSPPLQRAAEAALRDGLAEVVDAHPKLAGAQAALVAVRARDGAIVALVGGRDYNESLWDHAFGATRQVGSTVKPLTLLAAMEADPALSPAALLDDAPIERMHDGKAWTPANYDGLFAGPISVRDAIAQSRNIPAVLLAERVGLEALRGRLRALGLSEATDYPSVALGGFGATPVQLAGAYTVFAAGGAWHAPWLVRAAADAKGAMRIDAPPQKATLRYSERATFLAGDVLREVLRSGTGKAAARYGVGPGAGGKSGTTDDYRDAWFVGVTGPYAVAVWVGFDKGRPLGLTGGQAALPVWARFVAATGTSDAVPKPPADVVQAEVCAATGTPPCPDCTEVRTEWFSSGQVPEAACGPLAGAEKAVAAVGEAVGDAASAAGQATGAAVQGAWRKLGEALGLRKREPSPTASPPPTSPAPR